MNIDDIIERPFQHQGAIFDLRLERSPAGAERMPALAIEREEAASDESGGALHAVKREKAAAVVLSLLFHLAVAMAVYLAAANAMAPVIVEPPRVLHVTWVDDVHFFHKAGLAVHTEATPSPAAAAQPIVNVHREPPLPEKIVSREQEKKTTFLLNPADPRPEIGAAGQKTVQAQTGRDSMQVVALTRGPKTHGADSTTDDISIAKPRYRENAPPPYPLSARIRGYEGVVLISAEILTEGRAGNLKIKSSSGYAILDQSALEAVKAWKFDPARRMGKPVSAWVDIPVRYVLKNSR